MRRGLTRSRGEREETAHKVIAPVVSMVLMQYQHLRRYNRLLKDLAPPVPSGSASPATCSPHARPAATC